MLGSVIESWNWPWENMYKLEKEQSFLFCFSLPLNNLFLHFICMSILISCNPCNENGHNFSAHQHRHKGFISEAEFCALLIPVIPPFHTIHDHTDLDLSTLGYFYLLIITDTVFTFGLKEQRPFPDSHLESILKICSCNVNLYVTSHFRNHQM